ncbi:MAG: N-6 DNA methylase [Planctomycetia bacterium]|nr:N-6 DNA methylase [Planctomycetia bacterium]
MSWNPRSPRDWAKRLGLVAVPLFGRDRASDHSGTHCVLLDGALSSLTLSAGGVDELLVTKQPAQWAWSSNVNHAVVVSADARTLFSVRWDQPDSVREYPLSGPETATELLASFVEDRPESTKTSINRVISTFRSLRLNLANYGGNDFDAIRALNVLLLWADAIRVGGAGASPPTATLDTAVDSLRNSGVLGYTPSDFSSQIGQFPIGDLAEQLLEDHNGYHLDPYLLIRHASGTLFQEAHVELETPRLIQRQLFVKLHDKPPAPTGRERRDTRYTPTALARFLSELAIREFRTLNPRASAVEILDPACGSGVFLIESARTTGKIPSLRLRGMDNSKVSTIIADFAVRQAARSAEADGVSVSVDIQEADSLGASDWGRPDVILMNPPFLSWRVSDDATKASIRDTLGELYVGQSDTAIAFVARAIRELKPGGVLASVVPASFLESRAAKPLRSALAEDPSLSIRMIGRFRGFMFFTDAAVEPAFLIISRGDRAREQVPMIIAESGFEERAIRAARSRSGRQDCIGDGYEISRQPYELLRARDWTPRPVRGMAVVNGWLESGMPLVTDLFDVRLGIRTGRNAVFVLSKEDLLASGASKRELAYFRPVANEIRNGRVVADDVVFYPYHNGELTLKSEVELKGAVPWFYAERLLPNRLALSNRRSLRGRHWWELVEPRSTWMDAKAPRLLSPSFGQCGSFAYDPRTQHVVVQGNAWFWRSAPCNNELLLAYLAILNSYEFESVLDLLCPRVGGGQYELYRARLANVPIPDLSKTETKLRRRLAQEGDRIVRGEDFDPRVMAGPVSRAYGVSPDVFRFQLPRGSLGNLQQQFDQLATQWKRDRGHSSKIKTVVSVPAYQKIIGIGAKAVPLILREMRDRPDHWFVALQQITGENPVSKNDRGRLRAMAEAWLSWGRDTHNI